MKFKKGQRVRLTHHEFGDGKSHGEYGIVTGEFLNSDNYQDRVYVVPENSDYGTNGGGGWHWAASELSLVHEGWCAECDNRFEGKDYLCGDCRG